MDHLSTAKEFDTKRGLHYRYYLSSPGSTSATTSSPSSSTPVLLLLHGWPDGASLWQFLLPHLKRSLPEHPVLAPDLLGYGGTSKPPTPSHYTAALMTDDLIELLAHEGLDRRPLLPVGHDWGSYLAQRVYLLHPERCAGLVNLSVAFMPPAEQPFDLAAFNALMTRLFGYPCFAYWELFTAPEAPALLDGALEKVWAAMHHRDDDRIKDLFCAFGAMKAFLGGGGEEGTAAGPDLKPYAREGGGLREEWLEGMRKGGTAGPLCWYRAWCEDLGLETERALPKKVEKPYLFVGSSRDLVCRSEAVQQPIGMGLLPDCTVEQLEGGHWLPYERAEEVGKAIVTWMGQKDLV